MCGCDLCNSNKEVLQLNLNPDGSFPVASEAELKKALARVEFNRAPSVIPKGMTADNYQDMNILPGNRIGWEQKQEHLHRLSDLYTLGYLTEEEYEKRVEWVNNAQTIEQVNIVFTDLRKNILSAEADSYLQPAVVKGSWWMAVLPVLIMFTSGIFAALQKAWLTELILIFGIILSAEVARFYRK